MLVHTFINHSVNNDFAFVYVCSLAYRKLNPGKPKLDPEHDSHLVIICIVLFFFVFKVCLFFGIVNLILQVLVTIKGGWV